MTKKLVLIDDDPAVHDILRIHLRDQGFHTFHANNGQEGVALAKKTRPDMILLDFEMPGENGEEVFANLRSHEAMKDIPVCFLSSLQLGNQVGRVPLSRNVRFCKKPIEVPELLDIIEGFIGKAK